MPASGIRVTDDVKDLTAKVNKKKLPYVILKFSDNYEQIVVDEDEKFYSQQFGYGELLEKLPMDSPRFLLYDFPHLNSDKTACQKVVLVAWIPKNVSGRARFVCPSSVGDLKAVTNVGKNYVEGELDDVDEAAVCDKCQWERMDDSDKPKRSQEPIKLK